MEKHIEIMNTGENMLKLVQLIGGAFGMREITKEKLEYFSTIFDLNRYFMKVKIDEAYGEQLIDKEFALKFFSLLYHNERRGLENIIKELILIHPEASKSVGGKRLISFIKTIDLNIELNEEKPSSINAEKSLKGRKSQNEESLENSPTTLAYCNFWDLIHPEIIRVAKKKFEDGHYADAVESSLKEIDVRVKNIVKNSTGEELTGTGLMRKAFDLQHPILIIQDIDSQSGKDIQEGYSHIFAGAMQGIRNPKAHENISISRERGIHFLFLCSLLMHILDEAVDDKKRVWTD